MALNDPEQQAPELIEFDEIVNNENYPPWPVEVVSKWRIGSQLRHAMETESAQIGHKQGAIEFIRLLNEFEQKDMEKVIIRDIDIILEIMTTFDRSDLLKMLINHQYLSDFLKADKDKMFIRENLMDDDEDEDQHKNDKTAKNKIKKTFKPLQSTLKKAIRTGKIKVLNYLITQNVIPINLFDENIQSKQYETDLKSLLYNILRAIEIGSKKVSATRSNCFLCAQQFWPYLAAKVHDLKQSMFVNINNNNNNNDKLDDNKALKKLINNDDNDEADNIFIINLKAMNDDYLIIKYISLFMTTMFSRNKYISRDQLVAIFDVLQFMRERYITFEDRKDIVNGWKLLYNQLVINYLDSSYNNTDNCFEVEMIDYLISGGVAIDDVEKKFINNNIYLQKAVENGENNWKIKQFKQVNLLSIMPETLPIEINKLIIAMLCL